MKLICPSCRSEIPLADVNVSTDIALCRRCGKNFSYAELTLDPVTPVDLTRPPKGTWVKRSPRGFEVGVSTRHPIALFLVPFMCVWAGGSLGGIYGTQIYKHHFQLGQSLFGIPFLLGTILFGSLALMSACGKVTVRVENNLGTVFTGVGPIGWKRPFRWDAVSDIRITSGGYNDGERTKRVTLQADRPIHIGSAVREERQHFFVNALREMLRERA